MIRFFKGQPTEYVIQYVSGRVRRQGAGIAFYYLTHNTNIVAVPTSSADADFVFNEITSNFQVVTIQGQFTWRIVEPVQAATLLNYTIHPRTHAYLANERALCTASPTISDGDARGDRQRSLEDVINDTAVMAATSSRASAQALCSDGPELLNLYFRRRSARSGQWRSRRHREGLLRRADEATCPPPPPSAEGSSKENELTTDIASSSSGERLIDPRAPPHSSARGIAAVALRWRRSSPAYADGGGAYYRRRPPRSSLPRARTGHKLEAVWPADAGAGSTRGRRGRERYESSS